MSIFDGLTLEQIDALLKQGQAAKRTQKNNASREARLVFMAPIFDAMDSTNDGLSEDVKLVKPTNLRVSFDENGHIDRKTYRLYNSTKLNIDGSSNGGGNHKPVEIDMNVFEDVTEYEAKEYEGNWVAYKSHADACRALEIDFGVSSPVRTLHKGIAEIRIRSVTVTGGG